MNLEVRNERYGGGGGGWGVGVGGGGWGWVSVFKRGGFVSEVNTFGVERATIKSMKNIYRWFLAPHLRREAPQGERIAYSAGGVCL